MEARTNPRKGIPLQRARELRHNATEAEKKLWGGLRNRTLIGAKFRRQFPISGFIADFCCPEYKLVVEIDGSQHFDQRELDDERTRALEKRGYRVIRFWNSEVLKNTDAVLDTIAGEIEAPSPVWHDCRENRSQQSRHPPSPATERGRGDQK